MDLLDNRDWEILLEYDKDPFRSYNSIASQLGIHHATVADRISNMKDRGILEADNTFYDPVRNNLAIPTSEVIGSYSPNKLGLARLHVLFNRVQSVEDFDKLQTFCNEHPYTHYIAKLFGGGVSLYAQFDVPKATVNNHLKVFQALKDEFVNFHQINVFEDNHEIQTLPNYDLAREQSTALPSFDPIDHLWNEFMESPEQTPLPSLEPEGSIDNLDAELIRDMTINAKLSMTQLGDHYGKNKSTISRRISRIREQFVTKAQLVFGANADLVLGFNNTQIITGKFSKDSEVNQINLQQFFHTQNFLPFEAFISVDDNNFILYTQASIGYARSMLQFLYKYTNPYYLNQYQFYISDSTRYYFYHMNFDENNGYRTDLEWIKEAPFQQIS